MVVLAKDFYRVAAPSTLADVSGRQWVTKEEFEEQLPPRPSYGFARRTQHEVEMQVEALDVHPRWGRHRQSRSLDIPPGSNDTNSSAPSTPHEEGGSEENGDMGEEGGWHDAEDDMEMPSPKAWRSSTVYATQDGALVGSQADFAFPHNSRHSLGSGSSEGEEMQDAMRWRSESSESNESKFQVGPAEAVVQDANEKVRKWRGEHFPAPGEMHEALGGGGKSVLQDERQQGEADDSAAEQSLGEGFLSENRGFKGLRNEGLEATASEEVSRTGRVPKSPVLDRRKNPEEGDRSRGVGSFVERPAVVAELGGKEGHEKGRKEARFGKEGEKVVKMEKKGSWKKKASALFRSDTIQRIRKHRQQEKEKAQHEGVAEEGTPMDPAPPVILEMSADGRVELGPVEPVQSPDPPLKASKEKETVLPTLTDDETQVGGVTIRVKQVKLHRSREDDKNHAVQPAEPPVADSEEPSLKEENEAPEKEGIAPEVPLKHDKRSWSLERSYRDTHSVEDDWEKTTERVHRRRHRRGERDNSKSPLHASGGEDVRRSTGESEFRRSREKGQLKGSSVDFHAIIRTQRAAWEREREKWRSEIAGLQARVEQLKARTENGVNGKQNLSEEMTDGLAAPEQSDSPRIHSFPSPDVNGLGRWVESNTSTELPPRSRESLGRSSEGLRASGGSLVSQNDPLRRSADGQAGEHLPRSADLPPLAASTESSSLPRGGNGALQRALSEQYSRRSGEKLPGTAESLRKSYDGVESRPRLLTAEKAVQTGPVEGGEEAYLVEENERLRAEVSRLREDNSLVVRQMEAKKFNAYGNAAFNGQKYDEAVLHYSAALDAKANDAEFNAVLFCNRATVQSALSKHMDALSDCLAALETDPGYTRAYVKKADVLAAVGDYEGALEDLGKLEPGDEVNSRVKDLRRRLKRAVAPMDYYAVLGISSNCSIAEIKVSYRKLAMRFHPDRPGCNHGVIFQYISQAYHALSDPESRIRFDQLLEKSGGGVRR